MTWRISVFAATGSIGHGTYDVLRQCAARTRLSAESGRGNDATGLDDGMAIDHLARTAAREEAVRHSRRE